jgi:membrane carboxypeptidase/penicillin-binding protein
MTVLVLGGAAGVVAVALATVTIPQPNDFATRQETSFRYADGTTQIAHVGVNRESVPIDQIPLPVQQAVLAAEDRGFYDESGISPTGILRALKNDLSGAGGNPQGGSTITQQYVKNYYLNQQQTIGRKIREALISIKTDESESKDTILQNYLNTIYFGRNSYGIETASRAYFGVSVSALGNDPARAAYLAALIQSPYYFSTADSDPEAAQRMEQRWNYVLDGMVRQHWLNATVRARLAFPQPVAYRSNDLAGANGYLVNAAMQDLDRLHRQNPDVPDSTAVSRGGYTVVTTFRRDYMQAAQQAVAGSMDTLDPADDPGDRDVHIGLAAVDSASGAILGLYGGPDYLKQPFNDAMQAAGPLGAKIAAPMLRAALVAAPRAAAAPSPAAVGRVEASVLDGLADRGLRVAASADGSVGADSLMATPVAAAAAFGDALPGGDYHRPHAVAQVWQDGQLIWQADQPDPRPREGVAAGVDGMDGASQWAWTLRAGGVVSVAVNMYATAPGSTRNRRLTDMTPAPGEDTDATPNAQGRTALIATDFLDRVSAVPAPGR